MIGKVKAEVEISSVVHDFIKIKGGKKHWDGIERDGDGVQKDVPYGNGKEKEASEELEDADQVEQEAITDNKPNAREPPIVQVVHKFDSFESEGRRYIIFNAVGFVLPTFRVPRLKLNYSSATAIFIVPFPSDQSEPARISHFDFGKPVLEFIIAENGLIWVLLDGEWGEDSRASSMAQLIRWDPSTGRVCSSRLVGTVAHHITVTNSRGPLKN